MDIHTYLKTRRELLGLTQQQLADETCVSKQAVSKWENGLALPDIMTIPSLAKALRVRPKTLLDIIWGDETQPHTYTFTCEGIPPRKECGLRLSRTSEGSYKVFCTDRTYNAFLKKYGESLRIKTTHPRKKVLSVIRSQAPTASHYSWEERFDLLRDDCCARFCGLLYRDTGTLDREVARKRLSLLRETVSCAYRELLTCEVFRALIGAPDQPSFDQGYGYLCEALLDREREVLDETFPVGQIVCPEESRYLSPHFVMQALFWELVGCGLVGREDPVLSLLHYSIPLARCETGFPNRKMDSYGAYLAYQQAMAELAKQEGTTRFAMSEERFGQSRREKRRGKA